MSRVKSASLRFSVLVLLIYLCTESNGKLSDNRTNSPETKERASGKMSDASAHVFVDELKQTLERYLFGICPQSYKMPSFSSKLKNTTTMTCDIDVEQIDLAGRLAALALRAHSASRSECSRLAISLSSVFTELARTSANRQALSNSATNDANKKRKLSKSQKAKIQAKQRTALAVKKKAAALAAAAAAKITT